MKASVRRGFSFGLTSGVITTLGLMVGLNSGTHSKLAVFGGILTIAIADALSDSFGIHISQEYEKKYTEKQIWESTIYTFLFKFFIALTFIIPILLLELSKAVRVSVIWGFFVLILLNIKIAKRLKIKPWKIIKEHLILAAIVIVVTHYLGELIAKFFI